MDTDETTRVLLVEDDAAIREMVTEMLKEMGFAVTAVADGEAGVAVLEQDTSFRLLITDFHMPNVDGYELLHYARENHFHNSVIFTSSDSTLTLRDQMALGDCCASMLPKPFSFAQLRGTVGAALSRVHHVDCVHWPDRPEEEGLWQSSGAPPPP